MYLQSPHVGYCSGAITEGSVQATALNLSAYDCIDVQMTLSAFRYASMVDFGLTNTLWGRMEAQYLRTEGWAVVSLSMC